ncbi:prosaposin-like [Rhynchophorus ferrugineus]|uniref:prosaposin-like n=1 Tax=Rhynchophorus ferrugineus TaxID=354439 RepID=UPI003FCECF93
MKLAFVLVIVVAIFALTFADSSPPLVGANKCTWGPGYWCASKENAVECGTLKHCETEVWNKASKLL